MASGRLYSKTGGLQRCVCFGLSLGFLENDALHGDVFRLLFKLRVSN